MSGGAAAGQGALVQQGSSALASQCVRVGVWSSPPAGPARPTFLNHGRRQQAGEPHGCQHIQAADGEAWQRGSRWHARCCPTKDAGCLASHNRAWRLPRRCRISAAKAGCRPEGGVPSLGVSLQLIHCTRVRVCRPRGTPAQEKEWAPRGAGGGGQRRAVVAGACQQSGRWLAVHQPHGCPAGWQALGPSGRGLTGARHVDQDVDAAVGGQQLPCQAVRLQPEQQGPPALATGAGQCATGGAGSA